MNTNTPEAILLAGLKEDNELAFIEIHCRYKAKVGNMVYYLCKDNEITKDVVQEVFAVLWENRKTIIIKKTLEKYLIGIASNKTKDVLKSMDIQKKHRDNYSAIQPTSQSPYKKMEMEEIIAYLKKAVDSECSDREAKAFRYLFFDNLTYPEIAEKLETSVPNCRTYVNRAKKVVWEFIKKLY